MESGGAHNIEIRVHKRLAQLWYPQPLDHLDVQMSLLERKLKIHGMQSECVIVGVSKTGSCGVVTNQHNLGLIPHGTEVTG